MIQIGSQSAPYENNKTKTTSMDTPTPQNQQQTKHNNKTIQYNQAQKTSEAHEPGQRKEINQTRTNANQTTPAHNETTQHSKYSKRKE